MDDLSAAMAKILESNVKIEKLAKVIEEVGAKTEVIDDIVFKTQLLSFNASVEAERAGEHGRGFAVVAQEVGNLAQMSGKAAGEISAIVKTSIKEAEEIARENKERVENGGKLTNIANKKMTEVMGKLSQVQSATVKVVDASREQSQGINQITTSVESINQSTQETASTAEEAASASEELSGQSEALMALVNQMRTLVTGDDDYSGGAGSQRAPTKKPSGINPKNKLGKIATKLSPKKAAAAKAQSDDSEDAWEKI
jgi:methyl-accepting chemotaxis protein